MPGMFLRAGVLSLSLLLASRFLGLLRESALAAAFGTSGMGDVAVLMLTLPDWLAGMLASGALAYVLLPAWANEEAARIAASQRSVARRLLVSGVVVAVVLALAHAPVLRALASGLPPALQDPAGIGLVWAAAALPPALLAALWVTRLQHERDFTGLYAANLVVNAVLIVALVVAGLAGGAPHADVAVLGTGLLLAMAARLAWLHRRQRPVRRAVAPAEAVSLPAASVWLWAAAAAGLPLALPFAARSLASQDAPGALATFNYAWKLVELPLVLAIQLVGTLALGPIARAVRGDPSSPETAATLRRGFALAWTLACASAAGLLLATPAVAQLLFGWGRMQAEGLAAIAGWGRIGAWSLLPQALTTIAMAVLAAQGRLRVAVLGYAAALAILLLSQASAGASLMAWLVGLWAAIAVLLLLALRPALRAWLPWGALAAAGGAVLSLQLLVWAFGLPASLALQWLLAVAAAAGVFGLAWWASTDLRSALAR
jgi:peptidoglycan biosynthesis protein MviN/MurJ (putative lipid II flippase)